MRSATFVASLIPPGKRAVIYIRVSSPGQVKTDYDPEGNSLPAQRKACHRKADQMGLTIIDEYVEPGRSATEMSKRIAFRQMLARIRAERDVDYVIVYKLSRLARNRYDEALVGVDLAKLGVTLVSATEAIDETPVGQLMQGMLAVFNEYQSRESGADIAYKMGEKAKRGGTIGVAKLGYKNVVDHFEGRQIRTIAVDEERAPYVRLAFELYATGEYTLHDLSDELTDRGLLTKPTASRPAGPVSVNKLHVMLKDRYYIGVVTYKGEEYPGRHEALIDEDLVRRRPGDHQDTWQVRRAAPRPPPLPQGHRLLRRVQAGPRRRPAAARPAGAQPPRRGVLLLLLPQPTRRNVHAAPPRAQRHRGRGRAPLRPQAVHRRLRRARPQPDGRRRFRPGRVAAAPPTPAQ